MRASRQVRAGRHGLAGALAALLALAAVLLLAAPAAAENPVLDPEDDADVASALAEATEVQDVCYGYRLLVSDSDTGQYSGTYAASSGGEGVAAGASSSCRAGVVELVASITYTSSFSDAEDSASWDLSSTLPELDVRDVEDLGLSSGDLLDDGRSATTLLNAVLALPRIAAEQAGLPPVVLEPNAAPLPEGARPTGTPGSDWLRENGALLGLCVVAVLGGLLLLVASFAGSRDRRAGPRVRSFGPPPGGPTSVRSHDPWRS